MNKKRRFQAIKWITLALIPLLFVCFLVYAGLRAEDTRHEKLSVIKDGERTMATIISRNVFHYATEGDSFVIKYTLLANELSFSGSIDFHDSVPSGWNVGDQILVVYDRQNPNMNVPVEYENDDSMFGAWICVILFSLICCGLTILFGYKAWESWKLSKYGVS